MHFSLFAVAALALGSTSVSALSGSGSDAVLVERLASAVYDSSSSKHNPRAVTPHEKRLIGKRQASNCTKRSNRILNRKKNSTTTSIHPTATAVAASANQNLAVNISTPLLNITVGGGSTPVSSNVTYKSPFKLAQNYAGSSFWNGWDFFNYPDPTNGQVNYLSQSGAVAEGLAYTTANGTAIIKTDDTTWLAAGANRNSVRITSKEPVTIGSLVIMDAAALPYGPTTWPAFWTVGTDWPNNGEIDILEGVNDNINNQMTLHTKPGCTLSQPMNATGEILVENCDATIAGNLGCGILDARNNTYGKPATAAGGAVYAMWWTAGGIKIWTFLRHEIPADITAGEPSFYEWGLPAASWGSSTCDFSTNFGPQTIVLDITACGTWPGTQSVWDAAGYSGTCSQAVMDPTNFKNAFFEINSIKVYTPA